MAGDLTIRYASLCKESVHGRTKLFTSSRNADEQYVTTIGHEDVPANCSCPGFQFRGNCKHVTALYAERPPCDWTELEGQPQTPQQEMEGVCPKCGGETEVIRVGE